MLKESFLQLLVNDEKYLYDFIKLNEVWINELFELEAADLNLASNPKKIIDDGGYVFTLLFKKEVVGVCALFHQGNQEFQLARMAVKKEYQRLGHGSLLMNAVISKLKELNVHQVTLLTNSRLIAAIELYKKFGFIVVRLGPHNTYKRVDIVMSLNFI